MRNHRSRRARLAVGGLAVATLASVLGLIPAAEAATWTVKCDEDKLIEALNNANTNGVSDVINLKKGCTYEFDWADNTDPVSGGNALPIILDDVAGPGHDLTINGNGAKLVREDDGQDFRLLQIGDGPGGDGAQVIIKDLTVTGGYVTSPSAGGILVATDSSLTATNLKVVNNEVFLIHDDPDELVSFSSGGGILCSQCAKVALNKSTVADNEVTVNSFVSGGTAVAIGGGIAADPVFTGDPGPLETFVTLLRSSVKGNDAHVRAAGTAAAIGGGISTSFTPAPTSTVVLTLDDSSVTKNVAESRSTTSSAASSGGGINYSGTPAAGVEVTISDSEISANKTIAAGLGSTGGGLVVFDADTVMSESEITKNTAQSSGAGSLALGGGIIQNGGSLTVDSGDEDESSEISDNTASATGFGASARGGGYYLDGLGRSMGQPDNTGFAVFNFTEFEENLARSPDGIARGGGLYVGDTETTEAAEVTLNQADVEENEADSDLVSEGGGVYVECGAVFDDDLSEIENNEPDDVFEEDSCL